MLSLPTCVATVRSRCVTGLARGAAVAALALALGACGGGGGSSDTPSANTPTPAAPLSYTPSAAVLAAKKVNSPLVLSYQGAPYQTSTTEACGQTLANKTVYEQAHTVVFAAEGASELDQQEVAEYAEAAVLELRRVFSITTAVGVYQDKKIYVCVQPQKSLGSFTGRASHINTANNSVPGGVVVMRSPTQYFNEFGRGTITVDGLTFQANYKSTLVHEMTHLVQNLGQGFLALDTWFSEGIANYVARGKPNRSLDLISVAFAAINPLSANWPPGDQTTTVQHAYSTAQAAVAYLMSPTGANNSLAAYKAMLATLRADSAAWIASCQLVNFSTPVCINGANASAEFEALRKAKFVAAFEGAFKERDGTSMKLYAGPNNLKDSVITRVSAWW